MTILTALAQTVPFAFASGVNLYATIAVIGICSRFDLVALPDHFRSFENPFVIGAALTLYAVEFVADKVPWVDTAWDAVHTIVRPIGGAVIAVAALDAGSPQADALAAVVGGGVALTTHLAKAGTRAFVNTSPEPFSNWALSLGEDLFAIGLAYVALQHPYLALAIAVGMFGAIVVGGVLIWRAMRRRFARRAADA